MKKWSLAIQIGVMRSGPHKELSALLSRDLLIPILHNTTFEQLREISPLLGSRSGLSTEDDSMEEIAEKLSELVHVEQD